MKLLFAIVFFFQTQVEVDFERLFDLKKIKVPKNFKVTIICKNEKIDHYVTGDEIFLQGKRGFAVIRKGKVVFANIKDKQGNDMIVYEKVILKI